MNQSRTRSRSYGYCDERTDAGIFIPGRGDWGVLDGLAALSGLSFLVVAATIFGVTTITVRGAFSLFEGRRHR